MSPVRAARSVGWSGKADTVRKAFVRYIENRESELEIPLWRRGTGGRSITEATLRLHCPELYQKSFDEVQAAVQLQIERLRSEVENIVDERIAVPVQDLRRRDERIMADVENLAKSAGERFERLESRVVRLESGDNPDESGRLQNESGV